MEEITNKKFFKNYGFFVLILLVVFGILTYSTVLSKKSWINNLKTTVENVLNEYQPQIWIVEKNIVIDKPISISSSAYEVKNVNNNKLYKAVIIRITTFYGPLSAVYLCDEDNRVEFAGYSSLHGRINYQLGKNLNDKRVEYWQLKIPEILN